MNIDTKWLADFLSLAELQNFSRAANARHITQPAFGRHIRALEAAVGKELVNRNTNPISLTAEGQQFRSVARAILNQLNEGVAKIHQRDKTFDNPVRIAAPHSLAHPALLSLVNQFERYLEINFSVDILRVDLAVDALSEGECDFLLGFENLSLMKKPFLNMRIGQGNYLLVKEKSSDYDPFSTPTPIIQYSDDSYSHRLLSYYQNELPPLHTYPIFESSMCQLHKEMVLMGRGIAWIPDIQIQAEIDAAKLICLQPQQCKLPFQIYLYRNQSPLNSGAEGVWSLLQRCVSSGWQLSAQNLNLPDISTLSD